MRLEKSLYSNRAIFKSSKKVEEILETVKNYLQFRPHSPTVDLFHDDYKYLFDRWMNKPEDANFGDPILLSNVELCLSKKNSSKRST